MAGLLIFYRFQLFFFVMFLILAGAFVILAMFVWICVCLMSSAVFVILMILAGPLRFW